MSLQHTSKTFEHKLKFYTELEYTVNKNTLSNVQQLSENNFWMKIAEIR
jgi:hypothetical protein